MQRYIELIDGLHPPANNGIVEDVVMDEGARVDQLNGNGSRPDSCIEGRAARRRGRNREHGAEAFPGTGGDPQCRIAQERDIGLERLHERALDRCDTLRKIWHAEVTSQVIEIHSSKP